MFEDDVKKYYDAFSPSENAKKALLIKLGAERKKKAKINLLWQSTGSLAASFLLAVLFNYISIIASTAITDPSVGSVITQPSGYVTGGIVFIILLAAFITFYIKKRRKLNK